MNNQYTNIFSINYYDFVIFDNQCCLSWGL